MEIRDRIKFRVRNEGMVPHQRGPAPFGPAPSPAAGVLKKKTKFFPFVALKFLKKEKKKRMMICFSDIFTYPASRRWRRRGREPTERRTKEERQRRWNKRRTTRPSVVGRRPLATSRRRRIFLRFPSFFSFFFGIFFVSTSNWWLIDFTIIRFRTNVP